jgi:orotate phosphoribosyltransferase
MLDGPSAKRTIAADLIARAGPLGFPTTNAVAPVRIVDHNENHPPEVDRAALAGDLGRGGYLQGAHIRGVVQPHWFQTELILTRPGVLERCATLLAERIPENTDRLAARGAAAIALATAVALCTDVQLLLGEAQDESISFSGDAFPGARVVLLEDVLFTGHHAGASVDALVAQGFSVTLVIALLDRDQGGRHHLESERGLSCSVEFLEDELLT